MEVTLAEAAFGVSRELKVDTAVVCTTCDGEGTAPGTHPVPCETCRGAGEVAHVQRSFLGEIRTLRPCSACRGFGTLIPDPCRECSGDGPGPGTPFAHGQDPGRRRQRHPRPAGRSGRGRRRRRPAGDLYVEVHGPPHQVFTREGTTLHCAVTVPMTAAALGTTLTLPTLEADTESGAGRARDAFELDVRPGTQSGLTHRRRGRGVPGLRGGRGDLVVTVVVGTPRRGSTRARRSCSASSRRSAARRSPTGSWSPQRPSGSVFGRIRDAFNEH